MKKEIELTTIKNDQIIIQLDRTYSVPEKSLVNVFKEFVKPGKYKITIEKVKGSQSNQ